MLKVNQSSLGEYCMQDGCEESYCYKAQPLEIVREASGVESALEMGA